MKLARRFACTTLYNQPPSGGCVLKPYLQAVDQPSHQPAAFRRLCVETFERNTQFMWFAQPPSGGCVLKPSPLAHMLRRIRPAAFRRLCVETLLNIIIQIISLPAAFRRLCVETTLATSASRSTFQPPSGGCVLKLWPCHKFAHNTMPAAFRRLCVETKNGGEGKAYR